MSAIDLWQRLRVGFIAGALLLATACTPETETSAGDAVLSEIINNVQVGGNPGKFEPAKNGTVVAVGSLVRSGDNSLAKLAFSAGSFVRFSSNTAISRETPAVPEEVRFKLEAGRLRLSLFGHLFAVQTPLGLIQLDGFGDISYKIGASPQVSDDALSFNCYAGPCLFQSDVAAAYVQLNSLEGVLVEEGGQSLTRLTLSELDLRQFILDNPGSVSLIATLTAQPTATSSPTPTSTVTRTPTFTFTPSSTPLPWTSTPTASATRRPTRVVTFVPASTGTITATATETETPTPESGGGGGEPPPATSTSPPTPVPPTNTPVPPTNTPEPTITPGPSKTPG